MHIRSILLMACLLFGGVAMASPAQAADGVATRSGTLRAGPGADYPSVDSVSRGEGLQIYGCVRSYTWCDVSAGGNRGWFPGSRIAFLRGESRLPLTSYYTSFGLGFLTFGIDDYWGRYYSGRPWFNDHRWRHHRETWRNHVYQNQTNIVRHNNQTNIVRNHNRTRIETHHKVAPGPVTTRQRTQHRNQVLMQHRTNQQHNTTTHFNNRPALRAGPTNAHRAAPPARRCLQPGKC